MIAIMMISLLRTRAVKPGIVLPNFVWAKWKIGRRLFLLWRHSSMIWTDPVKQFPKAVHGMSHKIRKISERPIQLFGVYFRRKTIVGVSPPPRQGQRSRDRCRWSCWMSCRQSHDFDADAVIRPATRWPFVVVTVVGNVSLPIFILMISGWSTASGM